MAEILAQRNVTAAELTGNPGRVDFDMSVPAFMSTPWNLMALVTDTGNPPVALILDRVDAGVASNLVASTPLVDGVASTFNRTVDLVTRIRVGLVPGITPPSGGVVLQLIGTREG